MSDDKKVKDVVKSRLAAIAGDNEPKSATARVLGGASPYTRMLMPGQVLARHYKIIERIGAGGMGLVLKVEDLTLDNRVMAIKVLPPELARDKSSVTRLKKEALAAMELHHTNIMRVNAFEGLSDIKFLVMEYLDGPNLDDALVAKGTFSLEEALNVARQICPALDFAHSRHVIHRDIKPANLVYKTEGKERVVKITDFGIAYRMRQSKARLTGDPGAAGTLVYMAPELFRGKRPSEQSDQYSLAATLYELLAGHPPIIAPSASLLIKLVQSTMPEPIPNLPEHVASAIIRGLMKDPAQRFKSCQRLLDAMEGKDFRRVSDEEINIVEPDRKLNEQQDAIRKYLMTNLFEDDEGEEEEPTASPAPTPAPKPAPSPKAAPKPIPVPVAKTVPYQPVVAEIVAATQFEQPKPPAKLPSLLQKSKEQSVAEPLVNVVQTKPSLVPQSMCVLCLQPKIRQTSIPVGALTTFQQSLIGVQALAPSGEARICPQCLEHVNTGDWGIRGMLTVFTFLNSIEDAVRAFGKAFIGAIIVGNIFGTTSVLPCFFGGLILSILDWGALFQVCWKVVTYPPLTLAFLVMPGVALLYFAVHAFDSDLYLRNPFLLWYNRRVFLHDGYIIAAWATLAVMAIVSALAKIAIRYIEGARYLGLVDQCIKHQDGSVTWLSLMHIREWSGGPTYEFVDEQRKIINAWSPSGQKLDVKVLLQSDTSVRSIVTFPEPPVAGYPCHFVVETAWQGLQTT